LATIDERVVSLKLNNKQFVNAISESASSMDKLKNSLNNVGGATGGLSRLSEIARNTTFGDLANKALEVGRNLTVSQGLGIAAFGGIAGAALSAGSQIVSGFFNVMKDGFAEYETQINSVQTILANTAQNGTTLTQVNQALDELNAYADKTIYNFTEMTNSIGTFTVAGIGLEDATAAVKGFSNMAALSGANATAAAGATRQLAQAMSSGVVKLQDWMSIENAGIGGKQFQEAIMTTARMHGIAVDDMVAKNGSFRLSLQEGWLSAEIMTETLKALTGDLSEEQLKQMGYSEEQAAQMKRLAQAGLDSATQIRTFTQMIGTWGEALGSGWAKTWQIILGDFGEAQALFTAVGNWVGDLINDMSDARNSFLEMWAAAGGREDLLRGLKNIFFSIFKIVGQIGTAFNKVFGGASGEGLARLTKAFADFTEKLIITDNFADKLEWTFTGLFSVFHIFWTIISEVGQVILTVAGHIIGAFFPVVTGMNSGLFQITKVIGKVVYAFDQWFTKLDIGGKALKLLLPPIDLLGKVISWVVEKIHDFFIWLNIGGRVSAAAAAVGGLSGALGRLMTSLKASPAFQAFSNAIGKIKYSLTEVKETIQDFGDKIGAKLASKMSSAKDAISQFFAGFNVDGLTGFEAVVAGVSHKLEEFATKFDIAGKAEWLAQKLQDLSAAIGELVEKIKNSAVWDSFEKGMGNVGDKAKDLAYSFRDWINGQSEVVDKAKETGSAVKDMGTSTAAAVAETGKAAKQNFLSKWLDDVKRIAEQLHLPELFNTIKQKLIDFKNFFTQTLGPAIKNGASKAFGAIGEALGKANENLKSYDMGKILVTAIGGGFLIAMVRWVNSFKKNFDKIGNLADTFGETLTKLGDVLSAFESKIKAEALLTIAAALGILALALIVMSFVPAPKLLIVLGALKVLFDMLTNTLEDLTKLSAFKKDMPVIMALLVTFGIALLLIAGAVRMLGSMNAADAIQGIIALKFMLDYLKEFMTKATEMEGSEGAAAILMGLAVACVILSVAVYMLGSMDTGKAIQGIIALGAIIAILSGFMYVVSKNPFMAKGAGILMGLAVSCTILVAAIWLLGTMDTGKLIQGVLAIGVIIGILAVATNVAGRGGGRGAGAILAMSVAVVALVAAVAILGNMDIATLAKGLIALAIGLGILVLAMAGASKFLEGAVALALLAAAIIPFAGAIKMLSGLSWTELAIGLIALAGGLAILLVAGAVAEAVAPGLIVLTVTLAALGLALLPISISLAAFAVVLGLCATVGAAAFVVLAEGIKMLGAVLPQLAVDLANALASFIITLGQQAPAIGVAMAALLGAVIYAITANIPGVVNALFVLIQAMLTELDNHAYEFGQKAADALAKFIEGVSSKLPDIISAGTDLIVNFINGIGNAIPRILDAAANMILKFLEGIANTIRKYSASFRRAGINIATAIIDGVTGGLASKAWQIGEKLVNASKNAYSRVKSYFGIHSPSRLMRQLGHYIGDGMALGLSDSEEKVGAAGESLASGAYDAMKAPLDKINDIISEDPSYSPEIKPVLNLEEMQKQAEGIGNVLPALSGTYNASVSARPYERLSDSEKSSLTSQNGGFNITFNQTNNSPEALDAATIYRQTRNQLAQAKDQLSL
jgi:tape measure domain